MQCDGLGELVNHKYRGNLNLNLIECYSLHDAFVYPPKMYFPTRIIVTVGPLSSQNEWKVVLAQPSTDASQQRFH